jgi:uncharacterized protein (TIGR02598 family)
MKLGRFTEQYWAGESTRLSLRDLTRESGTDGAVRRSEQSARKGARLLRRFESNRANGGRRAFTLTEVTLALAIIGIVFVALLGLLPAGLNASRQAADSTVTAVILENLHNRLQNHVRKTGPADFSPAYFDVHGVLIAPDAKDAQTDRVYRADVAIGDWHKRPNGTSSLRPITIGISWPINTTTGEPAAGNPKTTVTYAATALTGTDWPAIDPTYQEKIEF